MPDDNDMENGEYELIGETEECLTDNHSNCSEPDECSCDCHDKEENIEFVPL